VHYSRPNSIPYCAGAISKAAAQFPSIKRASIIADIKLEFRVNAGATNPVKVAEYHMTAQRSYGQLLGYCGLNENDLEW
jgi:hypothetical protein